MAKLATSLRVGAAGSVVALAGFMVPMPAQAAPVPAPATHVLVAPDAPRLPAPTQAACVAAGPLVNLGCALVGFFDPFIDFGINFIPIIGGEGGLLDDLFDFFLPFAPYEP